MKMPMHGSQKQERLLTRRDLLKTGAVLVAATGLNKLPIKAGTTNPLGFCPITGLPGDSIRLFGPDFGSDVPNLTTRIVNGSSIAFTKPAVIDNGELETVIASAPAGMMPGVFEVAQGIGYSDMPSNMPAGLTLTEPICSWTGNGGARYQSFQSFEFPWSGQQGNCLSYWGVIDGLGRLSVDMVVPFDENCCPACPAGTRMTLRAYGVTADQAFEFEYQATLISTTTLFAEHIAAALCTILISAFESNFALTMACTPIIIDPTRINLTIGSHDASPFTSGAVQVELHHPHGSIACDSVSGSAADSIPGSMPGSIPGSMPGSIPGDCASIGPSCPSINVDFVPFTFA